MTHNNIVTDTSGQADAIKLQQARQEPQQDQKDSGPQAHSRAKHAKLLNA
jgi:hypothetical protein